MDFRELKEKDGAYVAGTYNRFSADIYEGKGATLRSEDGKEYIDFGSGIAVNSFGVNDEEWKEAVIAQINKVQHASNNYYTRPQAELAELLCKRTGAEKVFFSNSGAEANECAIKTARKYSFDKYGEGRFHIVTLKNSFHGRTMAALSRRVYVCRPHVCGSESGMRKRYVRRHARTRAGGGRRERASSGRCEKDRKIL